jgi:hypothetical protein
MCKELSANVENRSLKIVNFLNILLNNKLMIFFYVKIYISTIRNMQKKI